MILCTQSVLERRWSLKEVTDVLMAYGITSGNLKLMALVLLLLGSALIANRIYYSEKSAGPRSEPDVHRC